ncbi:MAG TPA: PEP-CTERM sorting domain-containing protein [Pyrinomonadaceae bacterium]|nr:PEP-CTERM sorting domain-containing protein [Pyrinomonadaceae bacterium]
MSSRKRTLLLVLCPLVFLCVRVNARAQTYNAFDNFRTLPCPSGNCAANQSATPGAPHPFAYGFTGPGGSQIGAGFTAFDLYSNSASQGSRPNTNGPDQGYFNGQPAGADNVRERVLRETGSAVSVANKELTLRPGSPTPARPDGDGDGDKYAVVRFVAPAAGAYRITGYFSRSVAGIAPGGSVPPTNTAGSTVDVGIRRNGAAVMRSAVIPAGPGSNGGQLLDFRGDDSLYVVLGLNETLDFYAGFGPDFNSADVAFLQADIAAVPEPSSVVLASVGLLAAAAVAVGRRRAETGTKDEGEPGLGV